MKLNYDMQVHEWYSWDDFARIVLQEKPHTKLIFGLI